ncbi:M48 family metalloprotease [Ferdinandcohnia sp. Marseille-Q9671]
MLPSWYEIIIFIFMGIVIQLIGLLFIKWNKKVSTSVEISLVILILGFVIYQHSITEVFIYIAFMASGYLSASTLTSGKEKRNEINNELMNVVAERIQFHRNWKRLFIDIGLTVLVLLGALAFCIYGPEHSPLKYFIVFGLVSAVTELTKRIVTFTTVNVYIAKPEKLVYISSHFESRKLPVDDLQGARIESNVDILKLHPLLTLFSPNTDFTTSLQRVLCLSFPGEQIYLTVQEPEKWKLYFEQFSKPDEKIQEMRTVLPLWHIRNIKRLVGKLYFATTVKGVSAYTGLLLLLYYFEVPSWIMVGIIMLYWLFNLYISDQVLKVAMDAKETTNQHLIEVAQRIFEKAGVPNIRLYESESTEYNGLATGMSIGKSMVTLTSATLKLPTEVIEGILAHEAIHVKKRDVLWGQLWRFGYMIVVIGAVLLIQELLPLIEDYKTLIFIIIWSLMMLFPILQSFCSQWMEVRADHLGATLLSKGKEQMAKSLTTLSIAQDEAINKSLDYSTVKERNDKDISSIERGSVLWRFLEFQFMLHPPMYWRIQTLQQSKEDWGNSIRRRWMIDRFKESVSR